MNAGTPNIAWAGETAAPVVGEGFAPEAYQSLVLFAPFTREHLAAVAACVLAAGVVIAVGRAVRPPAPAFPADPHTIDPAGRVLGALALAHWVAQQAWWNIPARFDAAQSLPLHVCDLNGLVAALALLTGYRCLTAILYFWGLGLSTQAFCTPVVEWGPLVTEFWLFWESHTLIVGAAAYVLLVRRFRPRGRDLLFALGAMIAYVALILPIDLAFGWNYGYVGNTVPDQPTIIDRLGPWPLRLLPMAGLMFLVMVLLWLPWAVAARRGDAPPKPGR